MADATLALKLKEFKKALDSLGRALAETSSDLARDSVIKRFEYSFELAWKCGKVSLRTRFGTDVAAPKECFREMRKNALLSDADTEKALRMTDDRNEIIHTYNEIFANEMYAKIRKRHHPLLQKIYKKLRA